MWLKWNWIMKSLISTVSYASPSLMKRDDCPLRHDARYNVNEKTELGISQRNALERIAEGRRRQDDRRHAAETANSRQQREARWTNARPTNRPIGLQLFSE
ncbi:unnamed protein product [Brassica napus]|uniref:(rape) hypothetical protein n=1 Tax=Brassica napus TaxID=3708 RepID=A0A816VHV2_BRANA|nr:unnamed protein product [Brassica napus]